MKKLLLLFILTIGLSLSAQTIPSYPTIKLTKTVEGAKQDSLLVVSGDKTIKHLPVSKLGTVKSVTGTDGITIANGTLNPVIGISTISQLKVAGLVTDLAGKVDKVTGKSLILDAEITRLATLANYTHPTNHPPSIITQDASNRFVTDAEKTAWNAKQSAIGYTAENTTNKNIANGYAGLGSDGKLISSQLPSITVSDTYVVASQVAMLGLSGAEKGDVAVRTDLNRSLILKGNSYSVLTDWQELLTPTSAVTTVFGRNGAVTAQTGDYNTSQVAESIDKYYQTYNQKLYNDATSSIQTQLNAKQVSGSYEPSFSKNTGFNKNFGTAVGTVVQGNDSRILNGQTAFGWGNHASAGYAVGVVDVNPTANTIVKRDALNKINVNDVYLANLGGYANDILLNKPNNNGSGATGTWGINISGGAYNVYNDATFGGTGGMINPSMMHVNQANLWNGYYNVFSAGNQGGVIGGIIGIRGTDNAVLRYNQTAVRDFLGLGSNAYSSTDYLSLTGNSTVNGTITATGFFNQSSDRRLKNILKRDGEVAYFTWKDGRDSKTHIGYIAQEVRRKFPDQVQKDERGMLSVSYIEILVEKIRMLEKRIEELEKK